MTQEPKSERTLDARLDEALEMTFPASDPVAVHSPDPFPTGALRNEETRRRIRRIRQIPRSSQGNVSRCQRT
jgi:hypothetical protein